MICQVTILIIETDSGPSKKKNHKWVFQIKVCKRKYAKVVNGILYVYFGIYRKTLNVYT